MLYLLAVDIFINLHVRFNSPFAYGYKCTAESTESPTHGRRVAVLWQIRSLPISVLLY